MFPTLIELQKQIDIEELLFHAPVIDKQRGLPK